MSRRSKKGFTLIELSLAIAFISVLAITVALIITDTVKSYHRGLMLGQINTGGVDLADEFRAGIRASSPRAITTQCAAVYGDGSTAAGQCEEDGAHNFVSVVRLATLEDGTANVPVFGAFCTGNYTYIWNSGYFWNENAKYKPRNVGRASLEYKDENGNDQTKENFRLLKVKDEARSVCISAIVGSDGKNYEIRDLNNLNANVAEIGSRFDIKKYGNVPKEPTEIISTSDENTALALYDLSVATPAVDSDNSAMLYAGTFILGTVQGGINVMTNGNYCGTPAGYDAVFDYCAINKFNFAAMATGES